LRYCPQVVGSTVTPGTPGLFVRLWQGWKRFGKKLADVQARLLLTLVYFTIVLPFGYAVRLLADPLAIKAGHRAGWTERAPDTGTPLARAGRQS
jgi:hypothetical protein